MSEIAYFIEGPDETFCYACAEKYIRSNGIETDEEVRYILNGADLYTSNTMDYWPERYKEDVTDEQGTVIHAQGEYVRDDEGDIVFDYDVKVTKQNRPSVFANVPNKSDVQGISDFGDCFDGEYCCDCGDELHEPYYFDCEACKEHIAMGEEGWEYQGKIDKELEEKYGPFKTYSEQCKYYICEDCRTKQNQETYQAFYNGVNAIADREGWGLTYKCSYMNTLMNHDNHLLALRDNLLNDALMAVQHGWAKDVYIIPRNHANFRADWHSELLEMLNTHLDIEVSFDITWNGVAKKNA